MNFQGNLHSIALIYDTEAACSIPLTEQLYNTLDPHFKVAKFQIMASGTGAVAPAEVLRKVWIQIIYMVIKNGNSK